MKNVQTKRFNYETRYAIMTRHAKNKKMKNIVDKTAAVHTAERKIEVKRTDDTYVVLFQDAHAPRQRLYHEMR